MLSMAKLCFTCGNMRLRFGTRLATDNRRVAVGAHANHVCGSPVVAQVSFWTVQALMDVKRELAPAVRRNRAEATTTAYAAFDTDGRAGASRLQVCCSQRVCLFVLLHRPELLVRPPTRQRVPHLLCNHEDCNSSALMHLQNKMLFRRL